ncbi:MAG: Hsp20/alpha crystallin family protein [Porphyromonas sp.]|uniref:Hsp20/alpha crystallin family protein n=1 Tax=Porphyromonas sp. TaxID=1924944 RepID=UPI001A5797F7|nr:Hsp20/alpha crystallin family protein [Porphyromonas sp.]MBL6452579.1 Hsp20/alpha crystallin family protein [Porphyromonas sp.]
MTLSRRDNNWMPALWSDLLDNNWMIRPNATAPAINVLETPDEFRVELAAPGMKREDFNIEINEEHDLVISMERHHEEEQPQDKEQSRYLRREFSYSKFEQTLILPDNVDEEKIQARMADGVLTLSIPKISEEDQQKARRTIAIE